MSRTGCHLSDVIKEGDYINIELELGNGKRIDG